MSEPVGPIKIVFDAEVSDRIRRLRGMMDERDIQSTVAHALAFYEWYAGQRLDGKTLQVTDGETTWDVEMDWR